MRLLRMLAISSLLVLSGALSLAADQSRKLEVAPTPFVLRTADGPARQIDMRMLSAGKPNPADGTLTMSLGDVHRKLTVTKAQFHDGVFPLIVPEPAQAGELQVAFEEADGGKLEARCEVKPARHWTFYMTPHTHYDIGFTHPQPEVIERLSHDLDKALEFCEKTADWPPESRYRWTVEVTALVKEYVARHTAADVARLMDLVKGGRVEICGFYLNMPTEVVGHEELIRCLYYAEQLRRQYGVRIDTAMIDDVPGYAWALPELLREAGISRVSFRANGIRGQFLWDRPGAVPRPFHWQSPDDSRVFMWYTDSYRDGNFFRNRGLHEESFVRIIRRNEAAGYPFDDIQLRMGGDNLPPELNASINTRAWNEKYLWPKVTMATNREFLEPLEARCGSHLKTFRGDIPSWWADGPASSAKENGMVRLLHDQLVATEALWTIAHLAEPGLDYPRQGFRQAYDKMLHFDEHTWGASQSITQPKSEATTVQWKLKAGYGYDAKKLGDDLLESALEHLTPASPSADKQAIAVWNTLAWPRTDVVTIPLAGSPLGGAAGIAVIDARDGKRVPAQLSDGGKQAVFVARDLPALGYAVYTVESASAVSKKAPAADGVLENGFYRVTASAERGGLTNCFDKELKRELLDAKADYLANQPIYERSLDGRNAISEKKPTRFERTAPHGGRLVARSNGPVFQELVLETSLPSLPSIRQHVRLYNELKMVDLVNVVTKEEVFDPEGVYFAFPFDVPSPQIRFEIADASMRPGKDQLAYSCQDFYAIQQWADVAGPDFGIVLAPLEAPLVVASGLNAYRWADRIDFSNGHLYSWIMNNYWICNFRAGQSGTMPFRYRLTSYAGPHDAVRATRFAWQPFHPPIVRWLKPDGRGPRRPSQPLLTMEGDPVIVSCLKTAEADDAIIVRLLEVAGKSAKATLRWNLPAGRKIANAFAADCVERPGSPIPVTENAMSVSLRPNEIATVGIVLEKP